MPAVLDRIHRHTLRAAIMLITTLVLTGPLTGWAQSSPAGPDLAQVQILDLGTAVTISLAENPSLDAARARVEQAAQVVQQAQSAYLPRLDATAGAAWVNLSQRDMATQESTFLFMSTILSNPMFGGTAADVPTGISNPEFYYSAGLQASWLLFNGFTRKFALLAARYSEQSSVQAQQDIRRTLLSAVISAYLNAQLARENIAIAKADEAFNKRLLTEARLRYEVGAGALSDVLNFQVLGNAAQNQIIQYDFAYQNAMIGLAVLMGVPEGRLPDHIRLAELQPTTDSELALPQADALIDVALEQRPDLQQLILAVKAVEARAQSIRGEYYPSIALSAGIEGQRPEDPVFEGDDFGSTISLGLSWNLFSGGLTRARIGEANALRSELQSNFQNVRLGVAREIQSVVAQIRSVQMQVELQEISTEWVQQQRDLVEKEYKSGVGSLVRLNEAQRELTVTQSRLLLTRVALRQAWYNLQTTTGRILEIFRVQ